MYQLNSPGQVWKSGRRQYDCIERSKQHFFEDLDLIFVLGAPQDEDNDLDICFTDYDL